MAITLFVLICVNNLCTSIMTALAGNNWSAADPQTRFLIVTSIAGNLTGTLIAFFRQQITNLTKGELKVGTGPTVEKPAPAETHPSSSP